MKIKLQDKRDFSAGLFFLGFGLVGAYLSSAYPMGSAMRMGAGYFPLLLCGLLALIGGGVIFRSMRFAGAVEALEEGIAFRPVAFIAGSVVAFGWVVANWGLLIAIVVLTVLSGFARRGASLREIAALSLVLAVFGVAVFSYGLGLPLPILPA